MGQKINVNISIDEDIKKKAMHIIQNDMNSTLSGEVENFLKEIVESVADGK